MPRKFLDLTGQHLGHWTVIRRLTPTPGKQTMWECQCDCGTIKNVLAHNLTTGKTKGCFKCRYQVINHGYQDGGLTANYNRIKRIATVKRKMEFKLSFDQFVLLVTSDCFYCGAKPNQLWTKNNNRFKNHTVLVNGIDRWDNSLGYCDHNSVPCCGLCNYMKGTIHGDDFLKQVYRINN